MAGEDQRRAEDDGDRSLNIPATTDTEQYRDDLRGKLAEIAASVKQDIPADLADADRFKARVEELARRSTSQSRRS